MTASAPPTSGSAPARMPVLFVGHGSPMNAIEDNRWAHAFRDLCKELGLKHIRTKPYTPKTNGKAERFIQTALREWAYARAYDTSEQRKQSLPNWTHMYNWHRPHGSLKSKPPISRLELSEDNLLRLHS